jgi:rhamnosyltransferase
MSHTHILGVIVTYHPEPVTIGKLVAALIPQVDALVIIDNASPNFSIIEFEHCKKLSIIRNSENLGLGAAYNQGIAVAQAQSATHLILFDQDSLPAANMVNCLLRELLERNETSLTAAAAGPRYSDIKGQQLSPFVRIKNFHLERVPCADNEVVEIDHLISSGSLIDIRALRIIGNFVEGLFIDCVDTEWCLRARHYNLRLLGVGNALMDHNIGEQYLNVFGRQLPMHTPLRLQYQFRNQIWIVKQPWVSWRWRIIDVVRCLKLFIVYVVFGPKKIKNIRAIIKGIYYGIVNRMGKI